MKKIHTHKGMSLVAAIIILAVIGIGGYSLYTSQKKKESNRAYTILNREGDLGSGQAEPSIVELQIGTETILNDIRTNLKLGTEEGILASLNLVNDLEEALLKASLESSSETKQEIDYIQNYLTDVRIKITTLSLSENAEQSDIIVNDIEYLFNHLVGISIDVQEGIDILKNTQNLDEQDYESDIQNETSDQEAESEFVQEDLSLNNDVGIINQE